MPDIVNDIATPSDWLKWEEDNTYSREQILLTTPAVGTTLKSGTVLGRVTATGLYARHNPAAVDGSEAAAGILLVNVAGTGGNVRSVMIGRDAIVAQQALTYAAATTTAAARTAVNTALGNKGILVREGA